LAAAKGAENGLGLGWNSDEYGFFSGAYGYFNVFLLLLFFGGLILDKFGIRFTGILSTVLMFGGALLKWYALGHEFDGMVAVPFFGTYSTQVVIAALGFAIYGVGCEICGITVSKVIVKWFTGHELALAMGVQVATARLGTAARHKRKLSSAELTVMQKGEPLTLIMEDEQVTVGIDLNDKTGIRINQGDSQKWKENTKREWDKYTFGCYGCWVMGDDGNLDYVPEEEYTEELWNEQKKNGERNRASFSMHK
jgi:hypothetical protein